MKEWMRKRGKEILRYNCGNMPDVLFPIYFCIVAALFLISMLWIYPQHFSGVRLSVKISIGILMVMTVLGCLFAILISKKEMAYIRMKDYLFLGLHDLSKENLYECSDIISRDCEAENIKNVLEDIIFSQQTVKQGLVLVGRSGCGKSTILTFFKQKYGDRYEVIDFSGNYLDFQYAMEGEFKTDVDKDIMDKVYRERKKIVLILDQFERYFFLNDDSKDKVRKVIRKFGIKGAAIIISMGEEYFSVFLNEFDVNNLMSSNNSEQKGVMRDLVNIIKDSTNNVRIRNIDMSNRLLSYKGQDCKNNAYVHTECPEYGNRTILEKRGMTIFYCESQDNSQIFINGERLASSQMLNRCKKVFGESHGEKFYEKHKKEPLIEQQIIFHMVEFEKKSGEMSQYDLEELYQMEGYALMEQYFDRQIAVCKDTFNALRVLYLLSSARTHHVLLKKEFLQEGLFECQFRKKGTTILDSTIAELEKLQLIKEHTENSDNEYEIAHDFIAESFLKYSNANIDRNVKNALDLYMADYLEGKQDEIIRQRRSYAKKAHRNAYYIVLSIISIMMVIAIFIMERFVYNPFDTVWKWADPYGEMFLFAPIINVISIWYLCRVYDKFVKFYSGKKALLCKIWYIPIMLSAISGMLFYPHVLGLDGLSLCLMGINVAVLLCKEPYHEASKRELRNYGLKSALMGGVYGIFHFLFTLGYPEVFSFLLMALETTVLWLLVGYAQLAHMTKDFLYSRRMDVTCDKK